MLAGLSDDDPAGITTYSILGARYGYEMIWLLVLLPFMRRLGRDREPMGAHALGRAGRISTGVALAAIASVLALAVLSVA